MKKPNHVRLEEAKLIIDIARIMAGYEIGVAFDQAALGTKKRYRDMAKKALIHVGLLP